MATVSPDSTVGALVVEQPARARLFEGLGLDYCCGGKVPLAHACASRGLDTATVVAMLNALEPDAVTSADWSRAPIGELCDHIVEAHHAFLRRELPRLSTLLEKVERAHAGDRPELHEVRHTFEELRAELEEHLTGEERTLFPSCRALAAGHAVDESFRAAVPTLESEHEAAGRHLARLADLTGGYDAGAAACNTHRAALDGLRELEQDLHEHIHEENNILFPRALEALGA